MFIIAVLLWILAFLGIALIYGAKPVTALFVDSAYTQTVIIVSKTLGVIISLGAIFILNQYGMLI